MRIIHLTSAVLASALALCVAPASAQSNPPANAPIPSDGKLVDPVSETPVGEASEAGALPGVGMDQSQEEQSTSGPGGLQNGVGAIGMSVPSQSSSNPVPVEGLEGDGLGIPLSDPQDR